ncbi:MAG TPA: M28 family metallopeptidase [Bacteroidales bacterium]|nr:M28 family metallopeptidase [Bacteroidales bacterium]
MQSKKISIVLFAIVLMAGCNSGNKQLDTALKSIRADDMKNYISVLASDDFLGRAPATLGEERTINYLADQFRKVGLQPADSGSYFQKVSLVRITADPDMNLFISGGKKTIDLEYYKDFIGNTPQVKKNIGIKNSDIVFVGYGINSPENNWNDYSGLDVKGKTVIMLVNDPGYATSDTALFNGKAMTYYGRWTYKYEEAARQGATAAIIIHETGAAAYPWEVVQNSFSGAKFYLVGDPLSGSDLQMQSWVTTDAAKEIFEAAGLDYDKVIASATRPGFKPIDLKLKASVNFKNDIVFTESNNVAGVLPGSGHSDEYIIYSAHWDHFGVNPAFSGDSILNGAVDNATGTAALIEIAKAFTKLPVKQDRSILFLAVTCEEQGLLGSQYYAEHPLFPLNKTVAEINMDGLNILGKTKDMTITGFGNSTLDNFAVRVLGKYGRYATPDPTPEKGGYFRSDHFSFAKVGVPSLALSKGVDDALHGKKWGLEQSEKWTMTHYHKPSDNYEPDKWNFDGMIDDIKVYFEIGYNLSISRDFPDWSEGSPFRALRDKMMTEN